MNINSVLRQQNKSRAAALAVLMLCVMISACMLFGRLMGYASEDTTQYIPLTKSNGITHVTAIEGGDTARFVPDARFLTSPVMLHMQPGMEVSDENTVWQGETKVEIFRMSYDNESGEVTVRSSRGDKVLAPGTGNVYEFALKNTDKLALDFTVSMEAYFSDPALAIPVDVRVSDYAGNYLAGSADAMVDVLELNEVEQSSNINPGYVYPYTLEWEWPFESGDDAYDTMLGNMAVEEDLSLTIVIKTSASYAEDPKKPGGIPQTGDTTDVVLPIAVMMLSMLGLALVLSQLRKGDADEKV